jgi:hypothetical protein
VEWSGGLSGLLLWHGTGGGTLVRACSSYPWAAVAGAAHQRLCVGKGSGCPRDDDFIGLEFQKGKLWAQL